MASAGSAGLPLMAAAVAAVLAMLVLPSSGHCPSPGPAQTPPLPAPSPSSSPAPAPAPPLPAPSPSSSPAPAPAPWDPPCSESRRQHCYSVTYPACYSACSASRKCTECELYGALCHKCRTAEKDKCTANCAGGGCDCDGAAVSACHTDCDLVAGRCGMCTTAETDKCTANCTGDSCNCYGAAESACRNDCAAETCNSCAHGQSKNCHTECWAECTKC